MQYVKREDLDIIPELVPEQDEKFIELFTGVLNGTVPVYFAAVPAVMCVAFDLDYRPDLHEIAKQAIDQKAKKAADNKWSDLLVYPRGKWFIVSDNYLELFASFERLPAYLPCLIMGKPDNDHIRDLQGPLSYEKVKKIFGVKQ